MQTLKKIIIILIFLTPIIPCYSQITTKDELNEFREFVESERKLHRESVNELEKIIRQERKDHMVFVESIYKYGSIIAGLVLGIVAFLGLKTFKDIREAEKQLKEKAEHELKEAGIRIQKFRPT